MGISLTIVCGRKRREAAISSVSSVKVTSSHCALILFLAPPPPRLPRYSSSPHFPSQLQLLSTGPCFPLQSSPFPVPTWGPVFQNVPVSTQCLKLFLRATNKESSSRSPKLCLQSSSANCSVGTRHTQRQLPREVQVQSLMVVWRWVSSISLLD